MLTLDAYVVPRRAGEDRKVDSGIIYDTLSVLTAHRAVVNLPDHGGAS